MSEKYDRLAHRYSEHDHADAEGYARRRAKVIAMLGPPLEADALVLDLACGDGGMVPAYGLERAGPAARLVMRRHGSYYCAASV